MASFTTNPTQCIGKFYIVQADDTCWGIAQKHNLTVSDLQGLNPKVNCNNLQIGQQLCVEKMTLLRDFYSIKSGDTCLNIAKQNSISEEQLLKYNPGLKCDDLQINQTIYTGPKSAPAAGGGTTTTTTTSAPAAAGGGTTTTTTTSAPAAAGGGTTTTTTTSAPKRGGTDVEWARFEGVMMAGAAAYKAEQEKKKEAEEEKAKANSYKMGGIENVDWIYTDDENDIRCRTDWRYLDLEGKVLQEKIPRTTMHNSDRRWCATNSAYVRDTASKQLAPLAPALATCVDFDGNYKLTDSQGNFIKEANELSECQGLHSYNGKYKFVLQSDGNAVLYDNKDKKAVWAANNNGGEINKGGRPYKLKFEGDDLKIMDVNNMSLYTKKGVKGNKLYLNNRGGLSSSDDNVETTGNIIPNQITSDSIYTDCKYKNGSNFKRHTKKSLKKGEVLFQCEAIQNGEVYLYINDKKGKLSLYNDTLDVNKTEVESTKNDFPGDRPWPTFLIFQQDNNLVFYDGDNNVLWNKQLPNYEGKIMINPNNRGTLVYVPIDTPDDFSFDFFDMYKKGDPFISKIFTIRLSS